MFAVMGITGNVGSEVARNLLASGEAVRAVVRDAGKGAEWKKRGCEIAVADIHDADSLKTAFSGAEECSCLFRLFSIRSQVPGGEVGGKFAAIGD